jgi:uncharacterized protein YbjT (DUF2867 family)
MKAMTRIFIAGASGAVGQTILALAPKHLELVPQVRPGSEAKIEHPNRVIVDLSSPALAQKMTGVSCVVQLIGTMRQRFSSGDTYETSDIGTTRFLVNAAKLVQVKHFILLSSVGAGRPMGAYLKAKAQAEKLVIESGLPFTIFRPSAFQDRAGQRMPGLRRMAELLGLERHRPIAMKELASALLWSAGHAHQGHEFLEGRALWDVVRQAQLVDQTEPQKL